MARMEDKEKFEYLLGRGILPSTSDQHGNNSLLKLVQMDRIEFLAFLLEGDYNAYLDDNDIPIEVPNPGETTFMTKSYMAPMSFRKRGESIENMKKQLISKSRKEALFLLDKSAIISGNTVIHEAIKFDNFMMLKYIVSVIKRVEAAKNLSSFKGLKALLEF